jgi:hypothetical protein
MQTPCRRPLGLALLFLRAALIGSLEAGRDSGDPVESASERRYAAFMFPPPEMCFGLSEEVYLSTAVSDGLFRDAMVRAGGLNLSLYINGKHVASAEWGPSDDPDDADEGLSHHFAVPGFAFSTLRLSPHSR